MSLLKALLAGWILAATAAAAVAATTVAPITVTEPYYYLDNRSVSNTGLSSGLRGVFGALSVVPNGLFGTTGYATNADYLNGARVTLTYQAQIVNSNEFAATLPAAIAPASAWTLNFSNDAITAQATTPTLAGAQVMGFARNVSVSGTSTPTFNWLGANAQPYDAVRLNFYNLDQRVNGLATLFQTANLGSSSASSFTVPQAWNLAAGVKYSVEISLIDTRDGTGNLAQSNLLSRSRSFFDFSLLTTPVPGPVFLPTVTPATATTPYVFNFNITGVSNTATTFIDPVIAVGYEYRTGAGNPNFSALQLPAVGDGKFDLYLWNGNAWKFAQAVQAGELLQFGGGGVAQFRIQGIEESAGLDASDGTAFVTGLRFTGAGDFTGTMTPLVAVPEPAALALWLGGGCLLALRRRQAARPCGQVPH